MDKRQQKAKEQRRTERVNQKATDEHNIRWYAHGADAYRKSVMIAMGFGDVRMARIDEAFRRQALYDGFATSVKSEPDKDILEGLGG